MLDFGNVPLQMVCNLLWNPESNNDDEPADRALRIWPESEGKIYVQLRFSTFTLNPRKLLSVTSST